MLGGVSTIETVHLAAPVGHGLRAAFAPDANMILHSLTLGDRELLAARGSLADYAAHGSTMGVPLLHPWANRLGGYGYAVAGTEVELDPDSALVQRDPGGLPIHGALPSLSRWDVLEDATGGDAASLRARLDWDREHPAFELFPFPHRLEYGARVMASSIEIAITLEPTADAAVPVSFGFHPYLRIPGDARVGAQMTLPVGRRILHDAAMIPTGETEAWDPGLRQLGETAWDDGFSDLTQPTRFVLANQGSEVSVAFLRGYRFAQVFAPSGSDFVCFEPMTAPTNALLAGGPDLPMVEPGGRYDTAFAIAVRQ
jgi:aldose 1-epimerase